MSGKSSSAISTSSVVNPLPPLVHGAVVRSDILRKGPFESAALDEIIDTLEKAGVYGGFAVDTINFPETNRKSRMTLLDLETRRYRARQLWRIPRPGSRLAKLGVELSRQVHDATLGDPNLPEQYRDSIGVRPTRSTIELSFLPAGHVVRDWDFLKHLDGICTSREEPVIQSLWQNTADTTRVKVGDFRWQGVEHTYTDDDFVSPPETFQASARELITGDAALMVHGAPRKINAPRRSIRVYEQPVRITDAQQLAGLF